MFWRFSFDVSYDLVKGVVAKDGIKVLILDLLERDSQRVKTFFRRQRRKVRNLDGSGHKGLAGSSPAKRRKVAHAAMTGSITTLLTNRNCIRAFCVFRRARLKLNKSRSK